MESSFDPDDDDFVNDNCTTSKTPRETDSSTSVCNICAKNISHLNKTRRLQHVNRCLDSGEQRKKFETKTSSYESTIDCPLCKNLLPPGPFRITHLKKCSSEYRISVAQVLQLVKTQEQIASIRIAKNLPHTKAVQPTLKSCAVKKRKNKLMPKTVHDEQLQLALTLSLSETPLLTDCASSSTASAAIASTTRHKGQFASTTPTLLQTVTPEEQLEKLQDRLFNVINHVANGDESKMTLKDLEDKVSWWNMHSSPKLPDYDNKLEFNEADNEQVENSCENELIVAGSISVIDVPPTSENLGESPAENKILLQDGDEIISRDADALNQTSSERDLLNTSDNSHAPIESNSSPVYVCLDEHNDVLDCSYGSNDMFECATTDFIHDPNVDGGDQSIVVDDILLNEFPRNVICDPIDNEDKLNVMPIDDFATKNEFEEFVPSNATRDENSEDDLEDVPLAERIKSRTNIQSTSQSVLSDSATVQTPEAADREFNPDINSNSCTKIRSFEFVNNHLSQSRNRSSNKFDDDWNNDSFLLKDLTKLSTVTQRLSCSQPIESAPKKCQKADLPPKEKRNKKTFKLSSSQKIETKSKIIPSTFDKQRSKITSDPVIVAGGTPKFLENNTFTILKRSNVTPMPEFHDLKTPELKQHLSKYGVRPMARRRAVPLLRQLYNETHPCIDDDGRLYVKELDDIAKTKRKRETKLPTANKRLSCSQPIESTTNNLDVDQKEKIKKKMVKDKPSLSQEMKDDSSSGEDSESDPIAEESFMPADNDEPVVEAEDINEILRQFFTSDVDLYRKILKYEPLPLKEIHAKFKLSGVKCSLKTFMDFMDAQCITFTMKDERKQGNHFRTPKKGRFK